MDETENKEDQILKYKNILSDLEKKLDEASNLIDDDMILANSITPEDCFVRMRKIILINVAMTKIISNILKS